MGNLRAHVVHACAVEPHTALLHETTGLAFAARQPGRVPQLEQTDGCVDGDACTTDDLCSLGSCVGGPVPDCDDGNPCTADTCDTASGCRNTNVSIPCDDGDACTVDDTCSAGLCIGGAPRVCDDGDSCTENDVCSAGACAGVAVICDDGNECNLDSCVDGVCAHPYDPSATCCQQQSDCDDGNACTVDACNALGDCLNIVDPACCLQDVDCDDGDPCTVDICPRNRGALSYDGIDDWASTGIQYLEGDFASTAWRFDPVLNPMGFILDGGVHFVHALRMLLGDVAAVSAMGRDVREGFPGGDAMVMNLRHTGGGLSTLACSWSSRPVGDGAHLTIYGDKGTLEVIRNTAVVYHPPGGGPGETHPVEDDNGYDGDFSLECEGSVLEKSLEWFRGIL